MEETKSPNSYHHGNVKNALVEAAMGLMECEEFESLSLRRLAKEVGVTPSAVYNHFADKNALMVAIKKKAFEEFNDYFDQTCREEGDCEVLLMEMGLAYYRYSRLNPTRFAVLFRANNSRNNYNGDFLRVSCRTINRLRSVMLAIYEKYQIPCSEEQVVNSALIHWSQLHGLLLLKDSGSILAAVGCQGWPGSCSLRTGEDTEKLVRDMVQRLITGMVDNHGGSRSAVQ